MTIEMHYVRPLATLDQRDLMLAGGKAAALGEMVNAGFPVPPGFCVTTRAYRAYVAHNRLAEVIRDGTGAEVEAAFLAGEIPAPMRDEITAALGTLGNGALAVRSSATAEDLPEASFAGQQETFLNVRGRNAVLRALRACWASLWNARVGEYRARAGIAPEAVEMAVLVQAMVGAQSAGVAFSANPVTGARDQIVVNAAWGLGEAVVSGLVTPDTITIAKESGAVLHADIARKEVMSVRTRTGVAERPVPKARQEAEVLNAAQLAKLADLVKRVEAHENRPMDLEWAFGGGELFLLQARPITALPEPLDPVDTRGFEWSREMVIERYPEPLTPYTASTMAKAFFQSFDRVFQLMGGVLRPEDKMIDFFYGRPYINATLMNSTGIRAGSQVETRAQAPRKRPGVVSLVRLIGVVLRAHRQWYRLQGPAEANARRENARDWQAAQIPALLEAMDRQEALLQPLLDNHANSIVAAELCLQMLNALARRWLGDEDGTLAPALLAGLEGNMTVKTNHHLWALAVSARGNAGICAWLNTGPGPDWRAELAALPGGEEFLRALEHFLTTYGHRSPKYEFRHPCWAEDPAQILVMLRMYLDPAVEDPALGEARQARTRAEAEARARKALPPGKRWLFNRLLSLTQTYFRLRENQQFYLMMMLPTQQRVLLALGGHLARAGWLERADDIWFLEQEEGVALARQLLENPANSTALRAATRAKVATSRADLARFRRMDAPVWLGRSAPAAPGGDLSGVPGSKGIARGKVRVIHDPEGFATLLPGEILVTPATTPAWTPLFGIAAGLITDYGGLLSHSGVVAREYGLPAVLGTGEATRRLKTGDMVEIDGTTGSIRKV